MGLTAGAGREVAAVAGRFDFDGPLLAVVPHGAGHVNDTYAVTVAAETGARRYVLQRLNASVFRDPAAVMANVGAVTRHLRLRLLAEGVPDPDRRALRLVPTRDGADSLVDQEGGFWRAYPFVEGAHGVERADSPARAREAARAFGTFELLLADYSGPRLRETIPGFHDTRRRYEAFRAAVRADALGRARGARDEIGQAESREGLADALARLAARGALPERIVHNDTKLDNVLFDARTGEAVCVIDLDTVMPGLALHDFGDLARAGASTAREDEEDLAKVALDPVLFEALAEGYLGAAGAALAPAERDGLVLGAKVIVFEQALRFLSDHLDGDRYYKIRRDGHNLDRCRTQLALLRSLEAQEAELAERVARLAAGVAR